MDERNCTMREWGSRARREHDERRWIYGRWGTYYKNDSVL